MTALDMKSASPRVKPVLSNCLFIGIVLSSMFDRESMFLYVVKSHMHKDEHMVIIEAVEGLFA